jgi:hypothetical protein
LLSSCTSQGVWSATEQPASLVFLQVDESKLWWNVKSGHACGRALHVRLSWQFLFWLQLSQVCDKWNAGLSISFVASEHFLQDHPKQLCLTFWPGSRLVIAASHHHLRLGDILSHARTKLSQTSLLVQRKHFNENTNHHPIWNGAVQERKGRKAHCQNVFLVANHWDHSSNAQVVITWPGLWFTTFIDTSKEGALGAGRVQQQLQGQENMVHQGCTTSDAWFWCIIFDFWMLELEPCKCAFLGFVKVPKPPSGCLRNEASINESQIICSFRRKENKNQSSLNSPWSSPITTVSVSFNLEDGKPAMTVFYKIGFKNF